MKGPVLGHHLAAACLVASLWTGDFSPGRQDPTAVCPFGDRPTGSSEVQGVLQDLLGDRAEHYGLVVKDPTGASVALQPDRVFYAASLYKLAVMYELFRQRDAGEVTFDEALVVTEEDAAEDLGTLDLLGVGVGDAVSVGRLLGLMITVSDNTSAVLLQRRLGGQNIDSAMLQLGLQATSVMTPDLPTTPGDVALLLLAIADGQGVSAAASDEMTELLRRQTLRDWIPAGVPEGVAVGNKTGSWFNAAHDAAIIYAPFGTYVLAILSELPEESALLRQISERVFACLAASALQPS